MQKSAHFSISCRILIAHLFLFSFQKSVRPEWVILKVLCDIFFYKSSLNICWLFGGIFWKTHIFRKGCFDCLLGNFWKNWATFDFNIWSHFQLHTTLHLNFHFKFWIICHFHNNNSSLSKIFNNLLKIWILMLTYLVVRHRA